MNRKMPIWPKIKNISTDTFGKAYNVWKKENLTNFKVGKKKWNSKICLFKTVAKKFLFTVCNNSGTYLHNPMNLRDRWNKQERIQN